MNKSQMLNKIHDLVRKINIHVGGSIPEEIAIEVNQVNNMINEMNSKKNLNVPQIAKNISVPIDKLFEKRGILDPLGEALNPLTGKEYENIWKSENNNKSKTYAEWGDIWTGYPMYDQREIAIKTMHENQCILITAGTGSGKTVLAPKYLLHTLNYQGKIAITIPRVAATKSAAQFSSMLLDVKVGEEVGYMVKGDKKVSDKTKLVYATDGYILAMMKGHDADLTEYDGLIIDEAHERNVNIDLILFLIKNVLKKRPNFKLVIMSATIDPKLFMSYYKEFNIKHIEVAAKPNKPIEEIFLPKGNEFYKLASDGQILTDKREYSQKVAELIMNNIILQNKKGDILALVPGKADCTEVCRAIGDMINREKKKNTEFALNPFCIQLKSSSKKIVFRNATESNYALNNRYKLLEEDYTRRIVIATEVAESSITFGGDPIDFVVDTGLSNSDIYYPITGVSALEKKFISKASHKQRRGRTGRIREGTCYNLFTEEEYNKNFLDFPIPPIMQEDITDTILNFLCFSNISHVDLPFVYKKAIESNKLINESLNEFLTRLIAEPPIEYVMGALLKLTLIGALNVDNNIGKITPLGYAINSFREMPVEKTASILYSYNYKCSTEVIDTMALLHEIDDRLDGLFIEPKGKKNSDELKRKKDDYKKKQKKLASSYGDHITVANIIKTYKEKQYNIGWEKGRQKLEGKGTGEGKEWARNHYLNVRKLDNAIKLTKDLNRYFGMAIGKYKREHPNKANSRYIFTNNSPNIHDRLEDNIMQAIVLGHAGNIVKKANRKKYATCLQKKSTIGEIDRNSLFNYVAQMPSTAIYSLYKSIFGRKKYMIVSKIPLKVIDNLNSNVKTQLNKCDKDIKKNSSWDKSKKSSKKIIKKKDKGRKLKKRRR